MGYCVKNQNDFPSKNRVWDFFSRGECYAGDFQLQVVEVHQEKEGVGTMIASGRVEHYHYDPFGNITHLKDFDTTGVVHDNPYRFSTKFTDDETDLVYYGFRFYNPVLGRWINRDPIEEWGGLNLYEFSVNNPQLYFDYLGLAGNDPPGKASCPLCNGELYNPVKQCCEGNDVVDKRPAGGTGRMCCPEQIADDTYEFVRCTVGVGQYWDKKFTQLQGNRDRLLEKIDEVKADCESGCEGLSDDPRIVENCRSGCELGADVASEPVIRGYQIDVGVLTGIVTVRLAACRYSSPCRDTDDDPF